MNKLTLEKIATSLLKACKDEGVMYKEAARIFNTEPAYFKMLEREDKREAIPEKVMDRFHAWVYSGKKLKEYKIPGSHEEARKEADADMGNRINEEVAAILNNSGATIIEPNEEPVIKIKPEALAKRKKELAERRLYKALEKSHEKAVVKAKEKRKYTRKPKETTTEFTSLDFSNIQIIPVAKAAPDVRPDVTDIQREESETDLLKSEIKTLSFLLAREHEANEVLRAQNGYLNARVNYKVNRATDIIRELNKENNALRDKVKSTDAIDWRLGYKIGDIIEKVRDATYDRLRKENNELEDQIRKYLRRGFWARVFNRPVK